MNTTVSPNANNLDDYLNDVINRELIWDDELYLQNIDKLFSKNCSVKLLHHVYGELNCPYTIYGYFSILEPMLQPPAINTSQIICSETMYFNGIPTISYKITLAGTPYTTTLYKIIYCKNNTRSVYVNNTYAYYIIHYVNELTGNFYHRRYYDIILRVKKNRITHVLLYKKLYLNTFEDDTTPHLYYNNYICTAHIIDKLNLAGQLPFDNVEQTSQSILNAKIDGTIFKQMFEECFITIFTYIKVSSLRAPTN